MYNYYYCLHNVLPTLALLGRAFQAADSFGEFLKIVKKPAAQDIQQHLKQ